MKAFVRGGSRRARRSAQIKRRARRRSSAPSVLGVPRKRGFDLLAWVLPLGGIARRRGRPRRCAPGTGRAAARPTDRPRRAAGAAARSRARAARRRGARPLRWLMLETAPGRVPRGARLGHHPCVLPLVPGYLSAVSAIDVDRLGERGRGAAGRAREPAVHRRLHRRLRRARRRGGGDRQLRRQRDADADRRLRARRDRACVPRPAAVARAARRAGLLARARRRGSGGSSAARSRSARRRASARCSPRSSCSRGRAATIAQGVVLLAAYSLGLGAAFLLAGRRVRARDGRVPLAARPLLRHQRGRRRDARRARAAALLQPRLVAARRARRDVRRRSVSARSSAASTARREAAVRGRVRRRAAGAPSPAAARPPTGLPRPAW